MSDFLQELKQPEYVHVLINHLPLTGLFAAILALIGSLIIRSRSAVFLGMVLVGLFALSAWPVYFYGEKGYDRVYAMTGDEGDAYLKRHRELAERWVWLYYVTAAVAAVGIAASCKWPRVQSPAALVLVLLALGSLVAGGVIADYGGRIRHPEFRNGPPPPRSNQSANEPFTGFAFSRENCEMSDGSWLDLWT